MALGSRSEIKKGTRKFKRGTNMNALDGECVDSEQLRALHAAFTTAHCSLGSVHADFAADVHARNALRQYAAEARRVLLTTPTSGVGAAVSEEQRDALFLAGKLWELADVCMLGASSFTSRAAADGGEDAVAVGGADRADAHLVLRDLLADRVRRWLHQLIQPGNLYAGSAEQCWPVLMRYVASLLIS